MREEQKSGLKIKLFFFGAIQLTFLTSISLFFLKKARGYSFPGDWEVQYLLMSFPSWFLSVPLFLFKSDGPLKISLYIVQSTLCLILGYGEGEDLWMKLLFLLILLIESVALFQLPSGGLLGGGILILQLLIQKPLYAWNTHIPEAPFSDTVVFTFVAALILLLLVIVKRWADRLDEERLSIQNLHTSMLQLMTANMMFQTYASSAEDRALQSERNRITREIHDSVGYTLTNLSMMMEACRDLARGNQKEKLDSLLIQAKEQVLEALKDIRNTLHILRKEEVPAAEGIRAINKLVTTFSAATGISVQTEYGNLPWTFGEEIDGILYRIVQEGLANAFRHGKATQVRISLWVDAQDVWVHIHDNGRGLEVDTVREGIGLRGMRERVEANGGWIQLKKEEVGCTLSGRIPLEIHHKKGMQDANFTGG